MSTATRLGNERRTRQVEAASRDAAGRQIEWEDMRAQNGPQQIFLSTRADIAITGGAAGGGKTFSLLMEPLRHIARPNFNAVCFRRTNPMIEAAGGLWDESEKIYPKFPFCGDGVRGNKDWNFPSGARISMRHLEHEKNVLDWYGSQIPLIMFDQLEQFTESQWWGMISRNRTTIGIRPYVRATCNPDADCFLAEFLKWWIDEETGYAIPERSGVIRWFVRLNEQLQWAGSWQELHEKFDDLVSPEGVYPDGVHDRRIVPKSVTFIPAYLHDNPILMAKDPGYRGNLLMQPLVERERLEKGNWKIRHTGGTVFPFGCFGEIQNMPAVDRFHRVIRYWDKAASVAEGSDYTAGVLMGEVRGATPLDKEWWVLDVIFGRWTASERNARMLESAKEDAGIFGRKYRVAMEQEPGSGGKESADYSIKLLAGYRASANRSTGSKVDRAAPYSSQAQRGNIKIVHGSAWNKAFLDQHYAFPTQEGKGDIVKHDDIVDAAAGAFNELVRKKAFCVA